MARRKLRMTPFARFFIVMLFLAPLAYIGASYYNGEDGIENIKKLIGIEQVDNTSTTKKQTQTTRKNSNSSDQVAKLTEEVDKLKKANADLRSTIRKKDAEIEKMKQELLDYKMDRN
ncbi:MAG: hypothetical protein AAFO07_06925 [Bacteroidota bacterium]